MMNKEQFEEWTKKFQELMPERMKELSEEMKQNLYSMTQGMFHRMDLVTREDFDVQQNVLGKTRALLTDLEARITQLEQQVYNLTLKSENTEDNT